MAIDINKTKVSINFDAKNLAEIIQNVKMILTTPVGTVPFDREFGFDWTILDKPIIQAKGLFTIEAIKKVKKYEPRVRVTEVQFDNDQDDIGSLIPKVVIDIA